MYQIRVRGNSPELPGAESASLPKIDRSDKWQKGNRSGLLDRVGEGALMLGTTSRQSTRNDLATFGDKVS
jgi:hypothetical protein